MFITQPSTSSHKKRISKQAILEIGLVLAFAAFPLFFKLPYRAYVYLSWEGAYRLSEGQIPFRDFGLPLGGMYWVVPALFFKIFGVQVFTLVKAQAFLNIVSGLTFRSILKTLGVSPIVTLPVVLLFCISYSFQNFWPWYNHTVIVYGLLTTLFVLKAMFNTDTKRTWLYPLLAGVFSFCSIFTKHDGGALFFVMCNCLIIYTIWIDKKWNLFLLFNGTVLGLILLAVLYFSTYGFSYWFNYGQKPHNARLSVADFMDLLLNGSQWLKFYFAVIVFLVLLKFRSWKLFINDKRNVIFLLLTLGILCIASVIQLTSYIPEFGNYFFHSFAIAYILENVINLNPHITQNKKLLLPALCICVVLWWSALPWEYFQRLFARSEKKTSIQLSAEGENMVGMHNFKFAQGVENELRNNNAVPNDSLARQNKWVIPNLKTLNKVTIPKSTLDGINRLKQLDIVKQKAGKGLVALNMTELTFLAAEIPFELERNPDAPLWHHLGVGMFNKQLAMYEKRIQNDFYDLVLFEYIPYYNNFFPFAVRGYLNNYYEKVDSFAAPRSGSKPGVVEVYIRKKKE